MWKWWKGDAEIEHTKYWVGVRMEGRQAVFNRHELLKELDVCVCVCVCGVGEH
jgi:hypothetical protein